MRSNECPGLLAVLVVISVYFLVPGGPLSNFILKFKTCFKEEKESNASHNKSAQRVGLKGKKSSMLQCVGLRRDIPSERHWIIKKMKYLTG